MQIIYYICYYILLLVVATPFICGLYATTRGYFDTYPDATEERSGFIFKSWYFFWFQKKEEKKLRQFKFGPLHQIVYNIKRQTSISDIVINKTYDSITTVVEFESHIPLLQWQHKIIFKEIGPAIGSEGYVGKQYAILEATDQYVWPEWLRKVLAGCITCYASVYGSLFFFVATFFLYTAPFRGGNLLFYIYGWSVHPTFLFIATWFCYCFSLAYLNTVLWRKTGIN